MRYCPYCGHIVPEGARFCPACGKGLTPKSSEPTIPAADKGIGISHTSTKNPEQEEKKKQSSLWGCTLVLLLVALVAGGLLLAYTQLFDRSSSHNNILAPEDDIEEVTQVPGQEPTTVIEEEEQQSVTVLPNTNDPQEIIRRRVQTIYDDALKSKAYITGINRYCTAYLKTLIQNAIQGDPNWIDFNPWIYSKEGSSPRVENIKVLDYNGYESNVKVTIRPYSNEESFNFVTITLINEEGTWLIDDFKSNGISIRTRARRAAEDAEIQQEIINYQIEY